MHEQYKKIQPSSRIALVYQSFSSRVVADRLLRLDGRKKIDEWRKKIGREGCLGLENTIEMQRRLGAKSVFV